MGKKHPGKVRRRWQKANTRSIVEKLLYNTKNKKYKTAKIKRSAAVKGKSDSIRNSVSLKFGSINVDGLGLENDQAVKDLLSKRSLDVRKKFKTHILIDIQ